MSNIDDIREGYRKRQIEEREMELVKNAGLIQDFIAFCADKKIVLSQDNFDYLQTTGIIAKYPNITYLLNSKVVADKEGLVDLDILEREFKKGIMPGLYKSENYILMPHYYFRRGHHEINNFSPRFIEIFFKYSLLNHNKKYIAIDSDRVRINVDNGMYMELDTWFGAKFKDNIADIEEGIVKLRPPMGLDSFDISFFFGNTYSLDIKWASKGDIKVFQAEEFKESNSKILKQGVEYHPVKYLHAEFDTRKGVFRHFDGAIHFYSEEEYYQRRDQDFNYNSKNAKHLKTLSQKLFKINGEIQTSDWVELTSHYLTANPLIIEYFEGKLPTYIADAVTKLTNRTDS